jgi:hypothetical protein
VLRTRRPSEAPIGGRAGAWARLRGGQDRGRIARQAGIAVHPVAFQRQPVGADIAFLEHMHTHAHQPRHLVRHHVHGAAIAEQHQIGDPSRRRKASTNSGQLAALPR